MDVRTLPIHEHVRLWARRVLVGACAGSVTNGQDEALCRSSLVYVAQRRYGFDALTAQRLAFACWLRQTGRLSDG